MFGPDCNRIFPLFYHIRPRFRPNLDQEKGQSEPDLGLELARFEPVNQRTYPSNGSMRYESL